MTELKFFGIYKRPSSDSNIKNKDFNIIVADAQWETFETLFGIKENYNFLNLSSEFAVNFILDYEKIDLVIISQKIGGLEEIINKVRRKKIKVYVLGRDLKYPVVMDEILSVIKDEMYKKNEQIQHIPARHGMKILKTLFKSKMHKNTNFYKPEDNITKNISVLGKKYISKKSFNKKNNNIRFTENAQSVDFGKTNLDDIGLEKYQTRNSKYDNNIHTEDNDNEAQYYNYFWKEVTTETDSSNFNNKKTFTPKRNQHEYQENGLKALKPEKSNSLNSSKEDFFNHESNSLKSYTTDVKLENNNSNRKDFKSSYHDINNSKAHKQEGSLNILDDKSQTPIMEKVVTIKQKTMVFIKAKGGVGSTFLSLYLAYEFRNLKTLIIDLNFSEGGSDIGYYLGMPKTPNMIIFTDGYNKISMDNSVISFKGHFDVLQPPPSYDLTKKLDMQDIYSIVDIARKKYHLIIFDLPNQINDIFFGVLDMANIAIMVSDYTPGSINRLASINKRFIYSDMERILVLNKNKNKKTHRFIKKNISEFFSLKEIVNIDENTFLSGKTDFQGYDFSNNKDMQEFKKKVLESLTCD